MIACSDLTSTGTHTTNLNIVKWNLTLKLNHYWCYARAALVAVSHCLLWSCCCCHYCIELWNIYASIVSSACILWYFLINSMWFTYYWFPVKVSNILTKLTHCFSVPKSMFVWNLGSAKSLQLPVFMYCVAVPLFIRLWPTNGVPSSLRQSPSHSYIHVCRVYLYTCHSVTEEAPESSSALRDQPRETLLADDCCSGISSAPPLTFLPALAADGSTLLGVREKNHASCLLNPLALFYSVLDFWYPSTVCGKIFCWWISVSLYYQSEPLPSFLSSLFN